MRGRAGLVVVAVAAVAAVGVQPAVAVAEPDLRVGVGRADLTSPTGGFKGGCLVKDLETKSYGRSRVDSTTPASR